MISTDFDQLLEQVCSESKIKIAKQNLTLSNLGRDSVIYYFCIDFDRLDGSNEYDLQFILAKSFSGEEFGHISFLKRYIFDKNSEELRSILKYCWTVWEELL